MKETREATAAAGLLHSHLRAMQMMCIMMFCLALTNETGRAPVPAVVDFDNLVGTNRDNRKLLDQTSPLFMLV